MTFVKILLTAQRLTPPEEVKVYMEEDLSDLGVWKMNIEWKHGFTNRITPDTVTYDVKIFYAEQMKLVHKVSECFYNKSILFNFK